MFAFLIALLSAAVTLQPPGVRTVRDIRLLPIHEARSERSVELSGTVSFCLPQGEFFYLQDETGGIRVNWQADGHLQPGERVTVRGTTMAGNLFPEVKATSVRQLNNKPAQTHATPVPVAYTLTMDDATYLDGQWVEVTAVVQRTWTHEGWLKFDLARGHGNAVAYVPLPHSARITPAESLTGAVIKLRGVCRVNADTSQSLTNPPRILVNNLSAFDIVKPARANLNTLLPTTARELTQFHPDPIKTRLPVRVTGVVTLNQSGRQCYIHDGTGVVQVFTTDTFHANAGDWVNVVGYPRPSTELARLDNAQLQVTGTAPLPPPLSGTPAHANEGKLEGQVVKFVGEVHEAKRQADWMTLTLVADGLTFTVLILDQLPSEREGQLTATPGSKVEVVGVVSRQTLAEIRRTAFTVMAKSDGLTVLESPVEPPAPLWWTDRRVAYLMAGFFGLFLVGGVMVVALRRQVQRVKALVRKQDGEREKLEGQLKLAAKLEAVGRLAGGIAHDFNNLLTVINGCAQLLEEEITANPERAAILATEIQRAGSQAASLTRQLLTFSRQRTVTPHPIDLNAVVTEAGRVLVRLVGERVTLRVLTEPNLPLAMAEATLLSQILLNLTVNARDAMPEGGTLTLFTSMAESGWVRLTAVDTGVGMTDEVKARIFEPFFTTKEVGKGTGLGLSTIYGIVQTLGGKIRFQSELGRGTVFEVDLPAVSVPGSTTLPSAHVPLSDAPTVITGNRDDTIVTSHSRPPVPIFPSKKLESSVVFLVEDDDAVRTVVGHVLEHAGFMVFSATEPEEALTALADHSGPIDLLITDVMMPKMSGRQLADLVRASRPDTRVLFMSGYTSDEVLLEGVREDQVDFMHKPFAPRELIEQVQRILGQVTKERRVKSAE